MQEKKVSRYNAVGPIALAVLVYSGQLGASPLLSWLPVDVTAASASLVVLSFMISLLHHRSISPWVLVPVGMWVLFLIPATRYVPGDYASDKLIVLVTVSLLCILSPFQLLQFHMQRVAFLATLVVAAILSSAIMTQNGAAPEGVLILEGANTIGTARIVGTGALILIASALVISGSWVRRRGLFLIVGIGLVIVMVATGSRGPLAGIIAGVAALILVVPAMQKRRIKALTILGISALVAYLWASSRGFVSNDRAFAWLAGERDASTQARQYLWDIARDYIVLNPQGTGWGGFTTLDGVSWNYFYPHNLVLELYVESGWIIGTIALGFIVCSLWKLMVQATDPIACTMFALAVFSFINSLVSGDINDHRLLWITLAVAWIPTLNPKRPKVADQPSGSTKIQAV